MKRRTSFKTIVGCMIATIVGKCVALGEVTKFYWPGKWSENALRDHLVADPKHNFSPEYLDTLSFQDCIDLHDSHHWTIGHKAKTPWPNGKQIPGTQSGRGESAKHHASHRTGSNTGV